MKENWDYALLTKNCNGIFISVGKFWKGIYFHFPKLTIRIFLWGIDWYSTDFRKIFNEKEG